MAAIWVSVHPEPPGILKSLAIKLDLYDNFGEGGNSTGLYINGVAPFFPSTDLTPSGVNLHSGNVFQVHITYAGTTLTVSMKDALTGATATQQYIVKITTVVGGNTAYAGCIAGMGGLTATQDILNWTFSTP